MAYTRKRAPRRSPRRAAPGSEKALQESIEPIYATTGAAIAECRKRRKLTQERLAELTDMSQNQIARIERGMRRVSLVQLENLANALEVSLLDLLPGQDAGGGARVPSAITSAWSRLSADDRRLVIALVESLGEKAPATTRGRPG